LSSAEQAQVRRAAIQDSSSLSNPRDGRANADVAVSDCASPASAAPLNTARLRAEH
jgi:hypothetical protein